MSIFIKNDLITATQKNKIELVKELIKSVNVNYKDKKHKTAIFYAVENGNIEIIDLLIKNGANIYQKDDRGLMAIHYAVLMDNKEVIEYFTSCCLNIDIEEVYKDVEGIELEDDRTWLNIIKKIF